MPTSFTKRQKEKDRQDRRREKASKRDEKRAVRAQQGPRPPGEDPDIAGIVPGPQPPRDD